MSFSHFLTASFLLSSTCLSSSSEISAINYLRNNNEANSDAINLLDKTTHGRNLATEIDCVSDTLEVDERLYPNQYLCQGTTTVNDRFGLDEDGFLAAWEGDMVVWSPGVKGKFLSMQGDGNLVLYKQDPKNRDNNIPVWASDCRSKGAKAFKPGMSKIEVLNDKGEVIWEIDSYGKESVCNVDGLERTYENPVKCQGDILETSKKLYPNEYLCAGGTNGKYYRFGLNARGQLALWRYNTIIWTPGYNVRGHYLEITNGKLRLIKENDADSKTTLWKSSCRKKRATLQLSSAGVKKVDPDNGDTVWMIDADGRETKKCDDPITTPKPDCSGDNRPAVSSGGTGVCRMRMIDHLNTNYVILSVTNLGDGVFNVTNNVESRCYEEEPYTVSVVSKKDGILDSGAGIPDVTCEELFEYYTMEDDNQLNFYDDPGYPCTQFEKNIIYFLIEEWFFFG